MTLIYRGAAYSAAPTVVANRSEVIGRYRGRPCLRSHFNVSSPSPKLNLKYRGVAYTTGTQLGNNTTATPEIQGIPVTAVPHLSFHVQSELEKIHSLSIQRNLERRLNVAQRQGNQTLIHLLQEEQQQLAS